MFRTMEDWLAVEREELTLKRITPQWLAGFFDGEGSVYAHFDSRRLKYDGMRVDITQKDPTVLFAILQQYPGGIMRHLVRKTEGGRVTDTWDLAYISKHCVRLLSDIEPFVVVKRESVVLALRFCELVGYVGSKMKDDKKAARLKIGDKISGINEKRRETRPPEEEYIQ